MLFRSGIEAAEPREDRVRAEERRGSRRREEGAGTGGSTLLKRAEFVLITGVEWRERNEGRQNLGASRRVARALLALN